MKLLNPVTFYKKVFKDILKNKASKQGRLLGLEVSDKYVSLAVSDSKNLTAVPVRYVMNISITYVMLLCLGFFINV